MWNKSHTLQWIITQQCTASRPHPDFSIETKPSHVTKTKFVINTTPLPTHLCSYANLLSNVTTHKSPIFSANYSHPSIKVQSINNHRPQFSVKQKQSIKIRSLFSKNNEENNPINSNSTQNFPIYITLHNQAGKNFITQNSHFQQQRFN